MNFFVCCFLVLLNIFSKNVFIGLECLAASVEMGPINAKNIAAGMILPDTANKNVLGADNPKLIPIGIASLISK